MKKSLSLFSCLLGSCSLFAEGASGSMPNAEAVGAIFTGAQTSLADLLTAALPVVIAVVGGGLLVWGGLSLVKDIRRAFSHGCLSEDFSDEEKAALEKEYGPVDW